jgi:uncharacterized protein (DUF1330 family)
MKGYWIIFAAAVTDTSAQQEYGRLWTPIAAKYNAKLKPLDSSALVESSVANRILAVEFPSYALAKACYDDPAYQQAKEIALRAYRREMIIIEGDLP